MLLVQYMAFFDLFICRMSLVFSPSSLVSVNSVDECNSLDVNWNTQRGISLRENTIPQTVVQLG